MNDGDALLKLLIVYYQLERMLERGEIARSEFTMAANIIRKQERRLIDELRTSPEAGKLFLDAVNDLESKLPWKLAEKLTLSYTQEKARSRRLEAKPEEEITEITAEEKAEEEEEEEEEATVELEIPPTPIGAEIPGADVVDEATAPVFEVEIEKEVPKVEKEIEEHAGIARVFSAFLQERNIRWGEIIAALIIVGFAIPLSITIWQSTGRIGKYLIFLLTTLVVFGAGLYVFSRLKLAITGMVLLVITLLMIPLHFLALDMMQFHLFVSLPVLVALGAVGYLIARLVIGEKATTFAVAYLIICALHLAVRGFSSISSISGFAVVGMAWASLAGGFWLLNQPQRKKEVIDQKDADRTYLALGVLSYAFALLFIRTIYGFSPEITFTQFSPVIFLFAVPSLCCGHQFLTKKASEECNARTGGTIIIIGAYVVTIISLIVAASNPTALLITSILATGVYILLLYLCRKIFVLYLSIIAFGIAYVSAGCILVGAVTGKVFSWHPLDLASTAAALAPLSLIYLAAGYSLKHKKLNDLAPHIHYVGVVLSGILILCSLADIGIARYVLLLYAAVLAILAFLWHERVFAYGACIVLAGSAFCFSIGFSPVVRREILANHALLGAFIALAYFLTGYFASRFSVGREGESASFQALYALPLIHISMLLTAVGAVMAVAAGPEWMSLICGSVVILNVLAYTLIYRYSFFVYAGCASALAVILSLCYRLDFMAHAALIVGVYACGLIGLGYYLLQRLQKPELKKVYAYPLVHSSMLFTVVAAAMAVAAGPEWMSLICGAVITLNLLAYTLIYRYSFFVYAGCASALAVILSLCYRLDFMPHAALIVGVYACGLIGLGYYLLQRLQKPEVKKVYAYPLVHSSMLFTVVAAAMAVAAGPEWMSLICGAVITLNLLAYTLIYRYSFFVYAGCASALAVILSLCYRLDFMPHAAFAVAAYVYVLMGLGYYLLRRLQGPEVKKLYAYPLVNSALAVSLLMVVAVFLYADERATSSVAIAALASIFYLFVLKTYPRKLWVYPFPVLMTFSIGFLTVELASRRSFHASTPWLYLNVVVCTLANLWVVLGLAVRKWKEAICSRLKLSVKDYDAPFFHWTTVVANCAFFMLILSGIVITRKEAIFANLLVCQVLISSSLFLLFYRRFQRYHTAMLYVSGLFAVWWASLLATYLWKMPSYYISLVTALYTIIWYALTRLRSEVRKALEKIKLAFSEQERGRLLKTVNVLIYCNTALALVFAFVGLLFWDNIENIPAAAAVFTIAVIYLFSAFDRKRQGWGYLAIAVSSLGCYTALFALLPSSIYGWPITIPFGLLSLGLAYLWEIIGVWMHKRREGMDFFSEPCKWIGIVFTAVAFIITFLFVPNVSPYGATAFQVSVGLLVFAGLAIFYLWIAWVFQAEAFVYIGEVALAGMIMFLRFTMPHWFGNTILSRFWPVLVVGVSFAVVGLSYALQRLRLSLYVRPSYYTAIFLPLLPLIGAWFIGMEISIHTLLGVSFFYFLVSYVRREKRYGYIAVAVFNIALQVLFVWQGIRLAVHPLVFVTPVGITLIGIAHLNRRKMDKKAVRLIRSFASAIIYAASALELYTFENWVSPIVLAGLCVLGILAGIALRIRPFLYLGTAFLLVDIFIQIYRAGSVNTWVWWISGVVFGLIILVLFAWFERKRERVLTLLRSLKDWE